MSLLKLTKFIDIIYILYSLRYTRLNSRMILTVKLMILLWTIIQLSIKLTNFNIWNFLLINLLISCIHIILILLIQLMR
jgi:hypothetical protein